MEISRSADFRTAALLALVCNRHADDPAAIVRRHPATDRLLAELGPARPASGLADILWAELAALDPASRPPTTQAEFRYWARRRLLVNTERLRRVEASLPAHWRRLAGLHAAECDAVCVAVGVDMIAAGALRLPPDRVARWLAPLGAETARRVVDRLQLVHGLKVARDLAGAWGEAYEGIRRRAAAQAPALLGAGLLDAARRQLSPQCARAVLPFLGGAFRRNAKVAGIPPLLAVEADAFLSRLVCETCDAGPVPIASRRDECGQPDE